MYISRVNPEGQSMHMHDLAKYEWSLFTQRKWV
jgi:hypothetical protein